VARSPLRRQNPREEPGALAAHAGICAGAGSNPRPLYVANCLADEQLLPSSEENGEPLSSLGE
jgi:hypothetical protein